MLYGTELDQAYISAMPVLPMSTPANVGKQPATENSTRSTNQSSAIPPDIKQYLRSTPVNSLSNNDSKMQLPPQMQMQQMQQMQMPLYAPSQSHSQSHYMYSASDSYWDRLMNKRKDVMKLIMFSLIVVLALGIHAVLKASLKILIKKYDGHPRNEWLLRAGYPLLIIFIMWNIKAFS